MARSVTERSSAKQRLLAAANELFYEEGVHTVGIDRVIERAGVAKASLYSAFGSKDELICQYLQGRMDLRQAQAERQIEKHQEPKERLLAVFDMVDEVLSDPGYHGCPFLNASAEAEAGSPILEVTAAYRAWIHDMFSTLASKVDVPDPEKLARQLGLLYDGANISGRMDGARDAGKVAKEAARELIHAMSA